MNLHVPGVHGRRFTGRLALCYGLACCGQGNAGRVAQRAPARHLSVTVSGSAEVVSSIETDMPLADLTSVVNSNDAIAHYSIEGEAAWVHEFKFQAIQGDPYSLGAWLCPNNADAVDAAARGTPVSEMRAIDVDDAGRFRGNGRYGSPAPTTCKWFLNSNTQVGVAAVQDGPALCAEQSRRNTSVEVAVGDLVSRDAITCLSRFGKISTGSLVVVQLARSDATNGGLAFELNMSHCLTLEVSPLTVTYPLTEAPTCPYERAALSIGGSKTTGVEYAQPRGTWTIDAAGPDRDTIHVSHVDVTFDAPNGEVITAKADIELPQVMY